MINDCKLSLLCNVPKKEICKKFEEINNMHEVVIKIFCDNIKILNIFFFRIITKTFYTKLKNIVEKM